MVLSVIITMMQQHLLVSNVINKKKIQNFRLSIRDQFDRIVPIGDFYIILQLTKKLNINPMYMILSEIKDYILKILLLVSSFFV
jgi:hypothetical protein